MKLLTALTLLCCLWLTGGAESLSMPPLFSTGTTIVGVCCRDGVVLGADTRSTGGSIVINKHTKKIHQISNCIFCCGAGTAGDCDHIKQTATKDIALLRVDRAAAGDVSIFDPLPSVIKSIISTITNYKAHTYRKPEAVFILGGVDRQGTAVFQIDSNGVPQKSAYASLGSGSYNAMAVLENELHRHNAGLVKSGVVDEEEECWVEGLSIDKAIHLVRKAVLSGIKNDLGSGSHVDLVVVRRDGATKKWRELQAGGGDGAESEFSEKDPVDSRQEAFVNGKVDEARRLTRLGPVVRSRTAVGRRALELSEQLGIQLRPIRELEQDLSCSVLTIE